MSHVWPELFRVVALNGLRTNTDFRQSILLISGSIHCLITPIYGLHYLEITTCDPSICATDYPAIIV